MVRSKILEILRQQQGKSVSGEDLGRQLQISRTAVSKQVHKLRQAGYEIESIVSQGHRLLALPDLLRPDEVRANLTTAILGKELVYFTEIGSTNDEAKKRAVAGCPEGTLIIAETQTGGRGRLSRCWFSPMAKGIWFSVVLRPPFPPQEAPKCTLMAAVALNRAIRDVTGLCCGIKWPNDILFNGRKLIGILTEMSAEMDVVNHIVIGMGVNVNILAGEIPPELQGVVTSLQIETGSPVSRIKLLIRILERLEELYLLVRTSGFAEILDAWRQETITLNRMVTVVAPDKTYVGKAFDIDADGALLVRTDSSVERVIAGDISIRPVD